MLDGRDQSIWVRVAGGIEILSGLGAETWNEPAAVRNALRELLSVLPLTHVELDLDALRGRGHPDQPAAEWKALLSRAEDWGDLLRETAAATTDAVHGRAQWGLGLPGPSAIAAALGDMSERGVLKAGLQLAAFLQGFREAGVGFVALDLTGETVPDKVVAPIFRNAEMYGWRRAAIVRDGDAGASGAEIRLLAGGDHAELTRSWQRGDLVGGGLAAGFWKGASLPRPRPSRALLFGEIPHDLEPAAIVAAGRELKEWLA